MKQISKKPKIFIVALLAFMMVLCGVMSFVPTTFRADENVAPVPTSWYQIEAENGALSLRLSDNYSEYFNDDKQSASEFTKEIMSKIKDIFMAEILPDKSNGTISVIDDKDDFWKDVEGNPKKFKDYITEKLSDPNELNKFLNNEYDMLLQQAVGEYLENKTAGDETKLEEEAKKIQDAIDGAIEDVVKEASKKAREEELRKKYLKENPQAEESQIEAYLKQQESEIQKYAEEKVAESKKVVNGAVEAVKENGGKAPEITVNDILSAIDAIYIDNHLAFDKYDGINTAGARHLLSIIPRPAQIAKMNADELYDLINTKIKFETTYGEVTVDFTFGFYGTSRAIQRTCAVLADLLNFNINGNEIAVDLNMPDVFASFLRSIYNSEGIDVGVKNSIFNMFNFATTDIFADEKLSYAEFKSLLEKADYKKLFENFLTADAFKDYFGTYFDDVFGRPVTDDDIETMVLRLKKFIQEAQKLDSDKVVNFLEKIPGLSGLKGSANENQLKQIVDRFIEIAKKINWDNYDADQIIEILKGDDINKKIYDHIKDLGNFEDVYNKFMNLLDKLVNYAPKSFEESSLLDMYKGDGKYNYTGYAYFNLGTMLERVSNALSKRGFTEFADLFDKAANVTDKKVYEPKINLNMDISNMHKVTFHMQNDNSIVGLLPDGTDLSTFAPKKVDELNIKYWLVEGTASDTHDEAHKVETMPDHDVVLFPVLELPDVNIDITIKNPRIAPADNMTGYDVEEWEDYGNVIFVYDETEKGIKWVYTLTYTVTGSDEDKAKITDEVVKTLLDPALLAGTNNRATDPGEYKSKFEIALAAKEYADKVTINSASTTTDEDTWKIEKANITLSNLMLVGESEAGESGDGFDVFFVYDQSKHNYKVQWSYDLTADNNWSKLKIKDVLNIVETGTYVTTTPQTEYTVKIEFSVKPQYADNVNFTAQSKEAKWIVRIPIDLTGAKWVFNGADYDANTADIVYDGTAKVFSLSGLSTTNQAHFDEQRLSIEYFKYENGERGEQLTGAPIDAGTYAVGVVAAAGYTVYPEFADAVFTIKRAPMSVFPSVSITGVNYIDGEWTLEYQASKSEYYTLKEVTDITPTRKSDKTLQKNSYVASFKFVADHNYKFVFEGAQAEDVHTITHPWNIYESGGITVVDLDGTTPAGMNLIVESADVDLRPYRKFLREKYPEYSYNAAGTYSISLQNSKGEKATGRYVVGLPVTNAMSGSVTCGILHISDDGSYDLLKGSKSSDYLMADTESFSTFVAIAFFKTPAPVAIYWLILLLVLLAILVVLAIVLIVYKVKKNKEEDLEREKLLEQIAREQAEEAPAEETPVEEALDEETTDEEVSAEEPIQEPIEESTATKIVPIIVPVKEEYRTVLNKSLQAKISQADASVKTKYNDIKNYILSFKKVRSRISWKWDTFSKGRKKLVKMQIKGNFIVMYLALDPDTLDKKYHVKSVKDKARFADIPSKFKIKSPRSLVYAKTLVKMIMDEAQIPENNKFVPADYMIPEKTDEQLIEEGLIKVKQTKTPGIFRNSTETSVETPADENK